MSQRDSQKSNTALSAALGIGAALLGAGAAYLFSQTEKEALQQELHNERRRGDRWQETATAKDKSSQCGVCLDDCISAALDPCGHTLCLKCASKVKKCPFCNKSITNRKRIYLS